MNDVTYDLNELIICKSSLRSESFGYPAKIIDIKIDKGEKKYLIHYTGWNVRYDIWIKDVDVANMFFKHTPEVEALHKKLFDESKAMAVKKKDTPVRPPKKREGSAASMQGSLSRIAPQKNKSMVKNNSVREGSSCSSSQSSCGAMPCMNDEFFINIPDVLRALLLDDSELVKNQGMLSKLPAFYTVDLIIKEYGEAISISGNIAEIAEVYQNKQNEIVLNKHDLVQSSIGILDYFNLLLGGRLLYSYEKAQYEKACLSPPAGAPGRKVDVQETPELDNIKIMPSSVYGLAHLIRLFVQLGSFIGQGGYETKPIKILIKHISDFMTFLSKNAYRYHDIMRDYYAIVKSEIPA